MRAILLCAGRGSRLGPLTRERPKCLVHVNGKAILDHQLAALYGAGIDDVTVVGGYRIAEIAAHIAELPEGRRPNLITNPFWSVSSSIGSLWCARGLLDDAFCVANGDVIFDAPIVEGALTHIGPGINLLVEHAAPQPDDMRVALEGCSISAVGKNLDPEEAPFRSLGILLCREGGDEYRRTLEEIIVEDGGPMAFHHEIVHRLAQGARVWPILVQRKWAEIDCVLDIADWERTVAGAA